MITDGDEWLDKVVEEMNKSDDFDIKMIRTILPEDINDILFDDIAERFYRKGWNDCVENILNLIKESTIW